MSVRVLLIALLLTVVASARGEVVPVDVSEWVSTTVTVTKAGWTVCGIGSYKSGKAVNFTSVDAYARSPVYGTSVTQLVVGVSSSKAALLRFLKAYPESGSESAAVWQMTPTLTEDFTNQVFSWRAEDRVRQFRLQIDGDMTGNWRVRSLTVYTDRVEPPQGLQENNAYSDALPVSWTPAARAAAYEAEAARISEVSPRYSLLKDWDFTSLTNGDASRPLYFDKTNLPEELADVEGSELNLQADSGGHIQVGRNGHVGTMKLPLPKAEGRTALLRMFRHGTDSDGQVDVRYIGHDGSTNVLGSVRLILDPVTHVFPLADDAAGLFLKSMSTRRIRVEDVKIATDYVPGGAATNVRSSVRTAGNEAVVRNLDPGDVVWRVRSFDWEGNDSPWSPFRAVTLDAANPRLDRPGMLVIIR